MPASCNRLEVLHPYFKNRFQVALDEPLHARVIVPGFLEHDLVKFRVLCGKLYECAQQFSCEFPRWFIGKTGALRGERAAKTAIHAICGRSPQFFLVSEVIGDQGVVYSGALSNVARRCPVETVFGKCFRGGIQ
ncbi:MAG: hypothetical protein U5K38_14170 [Woeseiaceae bacterium]|nr:hypothetical protein [Woeseiaceae bacterium]